MKLELPDIPAEERTPLVEALLGIIRVQQDRLQQQEATIAELKKDFRATVAQLTARLEEQASQIKKVNAKLELSRSIPQTIVENR